MYTAFFGFRVKPFDLLPNPDFLYPSRAYRKASAYLEYGVRDRAGFILITGEVGAGKTTLIRSLLKRSLGDVLISKVFNTSVDAEQLVAMINDDFGLETDGRDKVAMLRDLNTFLIEQYAERRRPVLIIDEAQNLTPEVLEEVRMLSNLETDNAKLLQIILVGQPELRERIRSPQLLQLRQRILVQCHLEPLTREEVEEYVLYRLERAGNRDALHWEEGVMAEMHRATRGIPRLVNILGSYVLLDAYAAGRRSISLPEMLDLLHSMDFDHQFWPTGAETEGEAGGETSPAVTGAGAMTVTGAAGGNGSHAAAAGAPVDMTPAPVGTAAQVPAGGAQTMTQTQAQATPAMLSLLQGLSRRVGELEQAHARMGENAYFDMLERQNELEQVLTRMAERVDRLHFAQAQRQVQVRQEQAAQERLAAERAGNQRGGWLRRWFVGG